jgi:hypothetical protein
MLEWSRLLPYCFTNVLFHLNVCKQPGGPLTFSVKVKVRKWGTWVRVLKRLHWSVKQTMRNPGPSSTRFIPFYNILNSNSEHWKRVIDDWLSTIHDAYLQVDSFLNVSMRGNVRNSDHSQEHELTVSQSVPYSLWNTHNQWNLNLSVSLTKFKHRFYD